MTGVPQVPAHASPAGPPPLALTMGEPAGIGGELSLAAWLRRAELPPGVSFAVLDDPARLRRLATRLGWSVPIVEIPRPEHAPARFSAGLPVLPLGMAVEAEPGQPSPATAAAVLESIDRAVALARAGICAAVVTNPIQKKALYEAGFRHPGHTEYLAELAGGDATPVMMLAVEGLRVVPATVHIPLSRVPAALTVERLVTVGRIVLASLVHDFGCPMPRLAVAGLNPHAGEAGSIGREDLDVIAPAVAALRAERHSQVSGPYPADTLFHPRARAGYDAALCMYHDQALIPVKTLDFDRGVNITLGLPFVRTSPDHGTALDIAGRGVANADSLMAAIGQAWRIAAVRTR
ncbi:MAG: 4-hydroxythreonine-4-phosphate dehydrogenase PdxA [Rhodospirillaceae bacterium]|nr:4-hydroxythreonine-4-phosphate dehydrogenase PdxA [Rhodospirillaceae bacterium]